MPSRYDKNVVLRRIRKRRQLRRGGATRDRFLNLYLWTFIFLATVLVLVMSAWLFI